MVDDVLREAADAVAAHLGGGAVGVVVQHEEVGVRRRRGAHEDQPVSADAEVAVAEPLDGLGGEVELLGEVVDDDEVVAEAVHLRECEFHGSKLLSESYSSPTPRRDGGADQSSASSAASAASRRRQFGDVDPRDARVRAETT